jgi:hypothetical protein
VLDVEGARCVIGLDVTDAETTTSHELSFEGVVDFRWRRPDAEMWEYTELTAIDVSLYEDGLVSAVLTTWIDDAGFKIRCHRVLLNGRVIQIT